MDKPSTTLDSETMEKLVSRDLVANVYKNGQYGCYRHAPIDSGILLHIFVFVFVVIVSAARPTVVQVISSAKIVNLYSVNN